MVCKSQCGFTIEDLFDLVFPDDWQVNGYLCMIYHCFLDDSKDAFQSKIVVSAGFFGTKDDWGRLRIAWDKQCKANGIGYFKSSEYNHLTDQFARFRTDAYPRPTGREAARKIRDSLLAVVKDVPAIKGIGMAIPIDVYNKVQSRPEADGILCGLPYPHAMGSIMLKTVEMIGKLPGRNMVAFVHDDDETGFDELRAYYKSFKEANRRTAKYMAGFQPLDDKLHPPLQMADMIASLTLEIGIDWIDNGRKPETLDRMKENIKSIHIWDEHYTLSVLKRELMRYGKPVPNDLKSEEYG